MEPVAGCSVIAWSNWNGSNHPDEAWQFIDFLVSLRLFETQMGGGDTNVRLGPLMAITLKSIIPLMAAFFVAQRYFIQGVMITGVKG